MKLKVDKENDALYFRLSVIPNHRSGNVRACNRNRSGTYLLREFVQVYIEGKKVVTGGHGLGAQDTVNNIKTLF